MRTSFEIKFILGVPLPQYNLAPFVVNPFRFTWNPQGNPTGSIANTDEESGLRHPICKVLEWDRRLRSEVNLTQAQLAHEEGTTKACVSQMLRLMNLPNDVLEYLVALRSSETIRSFSLRRLAIVAKLPADRRRGALDAMKMITSRSDY